MDFSSGYALAANIVSSISVDWFIVGGIVLLGAFDCLRIGARRLAQVALASPLSALLMQSLPDAFLAREVAAQFSTPLMQALLLGAVFIVLYLLIGRIGIAWGGEGGSPFPAALAGLAVAGIVVSIWIATPALDLLWHFGSDITGIFGDQYRFWWLLGSIGILAYVRG